MEPLADRIEHRAEQAASLHHRLVLVVGPPGSGKTTALRELGVRTGAAVVNVGLELSRRLLELTTRQRVLRIAALLGDLVDEATTEHRETVLLDNIEIVFDPAFQQNPLGLLQGLSRHRVVVATWPGDLAEGQLTYAVPDHPEYRRYPADEIAELMVVNAGTAASKNAAQDHPR